MLRKIVQPFYTAWVAITFIISLLLAFPFFLLISAGNNFAARRAMYYIIRVWGKAWLWLIGMPLRVQGQKPPARQAQFEHAVLVQPGHQGQAPNERDGGGDQFESAHGN